MQCSVGLYFNESCKSEKNPIRQIIKDKYSESEEFILKLRTFDNVTTICEKHEYKYFHHYSQSYGYHCCDPFNIHKSLIKKDLRKITLDFAKTFNFLKLKPGLSICSTCRKKLADVKNQQADELDRINDPCFEVPKGDNLITLLYMIICI